MAESMSQAGEATAEEQVQASAEQSPSRLVAVTLDPASIQPASADIEHERAVAIYDLVEENNFHPKGHDAGGPYKLDLSLIERKLVLNITLEDDSPVITHILSLTPFRKIVKDYFMICDSYHEAIKTATPSRIEAIDMGRRGLHNEGSQILLSRLEGKIDTDFPTARRLFTLICALHWRG